MSCRWHRGRLSVRGDAGGFLGQAGPAFGRLLDAGWVGRLSLDKVDDEAAAELVTAWPEVASAGGLRLDGPLGDAGVADVAGLPNLCGLDTHESIGLTDAGLGELQRAEGLASFVACQCHNFTDAGLVSVGRLEGLRHLGLQWCDGVTDAGLTWLAGLRELDWLTVRGCHVTGTGLAWLAGRSLGYLDLICNHHLTETGLIGLGRMASLGGVDLDNSVGVTDAALAALATVPGLGRIDAWSAGGYGDPGVAALGSAAGLKYAYLSSETLTGAGLRPLAALPLLESLHLLYCPALRDDDLAAFADFPALDGLCLSRCDGLTDAGLIHLARLKRLRWLELVTSSPRRLGDHPFSQAAVEALRAALPDCRIRG